MQAANAGERIPGGIANGIIGTMLMLLMAVAAAVPVGIMCGVYLSENGKSRFAQAVSYLTDLLQGTPSVIIGIVTYIWVVVPMHGYSAFAGSVALFVMMLPLIIRSTEETMKILPASLNKRGTFLSGGQQQRLCIARALALKPDVLLMDEPTSALDPIATKHIEELLVQLKESVTILIVTHNMGQAQRIAKNSMFMYLGELVEYDNTELMFNNPADERTRAYLTGKMG